MKKTLSVIGFLLAIIAVLLAVLFHWTFLLVAISLILFSIFVKK